MKSIFRRYICCLLFVLTFSYVYAQQKCATYEYYLMQVERDPSLKLRRIEFEQRLAEEIVRSKEISVESLCFIPVVVHIVLKNPSVITNEQVKAQIRALNKYYSNYNLLLVPSEFKSIDPEIKTKFRLAKMGEDGLTTIGITRTITYIDKFSDIDKVKYSSQGGKDIWDPDKFLNIWVCDLNDEIEEYEPFPDGGIWQADGVIVDYKVFGSIRKMPFENFPW